MKTVKELKREIDKVVKPGYIYQTNLSWSERLVDFACGLGIGARLIQVDNQMIYEFYVDTQFVSSKEIAYDEISMCKDIIEILEQNRGFVLKRLKKYTVEEYEQKQIESKKRQEEIMHFFSSLIHEEKSVKEYEDYEFDEDKIIIDKK